MKHVVNGVTPERFVKTDRQDGKDIGYILVFWCNQWVTAAYREGDNEWAHGNYWGANEKEKAIEDLNKRVANKGRL
jgi:hypothetical protein